MLIWVKIKDYYIKRVIVSADAPGNERNEDKKSALAVWMQWTDS